MKNIRQWIKQIWHNIKPDISIEYIAYYEEAKLNQKYLYVEPYKIGNIRYVLLCDPKFIVHKDNYTAACYLIRPDVTTIFNGAKYQKMDVFEWDGRNYRMLKLKALQSYKYLIEKEKEIHAS